MLSGRLEQVLLVSIKTTLVHVLPVFIIIIIV
jgi:hypothetical protein